MSHTTAGHRCGECWEFGHGQLECVYPARMADLRAHPVQQPLFAPCAVPECKAPRTHATVAHHCEGCRRRIGDRWHSCAVRVAEDNGQFGEATGWWPQLTRVHAALSAQVDPQAHFATFYAGMGCTWTVFIGLDDVCRAVFLHSDNQGQYEPTIDDRDLVQWAERGRTQLRVDHMWADDDGAASEEEGVEGDGPGPAPTTMTCCPLCRTALAGKPPAAATPEEIADKECVVCLAAPVVMKLPACGHACLCGECATRWDPGT
jgi:hypothetical protein